MNKTFKTIGKVLAVIITPGSMILLFILLLLFCYKFIKNKKAKKVDGVAEDKTTEGSTEELKQTK